MYRLQVYTGKNSELSTGEQGLSTRVVHKLIRGKESVNPKIYMDNYYSSPHLFLSLYDKSVGACGTIRTKRKYYPKYLIVSACSVKEGSLIIGVVPPLAAWVWKDKRLINFLSNMHEATGRGHCPEDHCTSPGLPSSSARLPSIHARGGQRRLAYWVLQLREEV